MGIAQTINFEFKDRAELVKFMEQICSDLVSSTEDNKWLIRSFQNSRMRFEISFTEDGFYTHRSGEYFGFFGYFLEELTGRFGRVVIEDV